jgi:hypothetical protein
LAVGSWQLAVGSWQLAVGSWQLAVYASAFAETRPLAPAAELLQSAIPEFLSPFRIQELQNTGNAVCSKKFQEESLNNEATILAANRECCPATPEPYPLAPAACVATLIDGQDFISPSSPERLIHLFPVVD